MNRLKRAIAITSSTLVGYTQTDYPMEYGNCFSIKTKDQKEYKVHYNGLLVFSKKEKP